ncbi:TrmB family transcriptional regulator [Candidatus Woesearchaeota archaeon]|nr:TrmB family transcriptional regulator [Candidatus Woesearchaeota archaeon]
MNTKALEKLGLTKNEIAIYLALLELGASTTSPITRKSQLHSSRVYESLNKLIEKGLVSSLIKSNRKYFSAADPEVILDILDEEKREINKILPQLKAIKPLKPIEEKSTMYEGYKGVRYVFDEIVRTLKKNDEVLVFGARNEDENFMAKTYFREYTQRRIAKGIKMRMIFNADSRETGKIYSKFKNTEVRYMPPNMKTPSAINIFGNNVGTLVLKQKPVIFVITSKEVADSYRAFFKMLWQLAE